MPKVIDLAPRQAGVRQPASDKAEAAAASASPAPPVGTAPRAALTISSKNYSSWSLRGWLMARFSGIEFDEVLVPPDDLDARQEILLLAPSIRVPCLTHGHIEVWDTLAIGEYLNEVRPESGLLPADQAARAHCRAICGEMHSGFASLRSALPMNLKASFPNFKIWARAAADIERICAIWRECIAGYGGPYLFGERRCIADAMYAPVVTRFITYDVGLDAVCSAYCRQIVAMVEMSDWIAAAKAEPEDIEELEMEF